MEETTSKLNGKETFVRVGLSTLGCKVNQCDTAALARDLQSANFQLVPFNAIADVYIINTCSVTAFADFQARQLVRRALRVNPRARIVVTGCYAQTQAAALAGIEGITFVVGNDQKRRIADLIAGPAPDTPGVMVGNIFLEKEILAAPATRLSGRTRAFFKIQDGCNAFCSYCIVPFARGQSRSLPLPGVLRGVQDFIGQDCREIVLTGIHLGDYGHDLQPPTDLARMLEQLLAQNPAIRFRLSSIEPNEISDDLIRLFGRHENLCPHLHIPLQSGDDDILQRMKRQYDTVFYRDLVEKVAGRVADAAIGIDVMVGFPGEGDREFDHTRQLLESLPVAYLHVFPYSERPGTAARALEPKVPEKIKKERAAILRELGARKRETFARRFLGKTLPVLIEQTRDKKTGLAKGFSHNYLPVILDKHPAIPVNTMVRVKIEHYREGKLTGGVVHG